MQKKNCPIWPTFSRNCLHFLCWFHTKSLQHSWLQIESLKLLKVKVSSNADFFYAHKTYKILPTQGTTEKDIQLWSYHRWRRFVGETQIQSLTPDGSADACLPAFNLLQNLLLPTSLSECTIWHTYNVSLDCWSSFEKVISELPTKSFLVFFKTILTEYSPSVKTKPMRLKKILQLISYEAITLL